MKQQDKPSKLPLIPRRIHTRSIDFLKQFGLMLIGLALVTNVSAIDLSSLPPFEPDKENREFTWLSIHPDGERWLITECTDRVNPSRDNCYLFLYNLKTKEYRRYELSEDYIYAEAEFSPSGQYIVGKRIPYFDTVSYKEFEKHLRDTEIFQMRADGSDLRVLPIPKGLVSRPLMSPDESKVAFWLAAKLGQARGKTLTVDYELQELDLISGETRLFAGPFHLSLVGGFAYRDNNHIVAQAYGSVRSEKFGYAYRARTNSSEVYCFDREQTSLSDPCVIDVNFASMPTLNKQGDLYVFGAAEKRGMSVFEILPNEPRHRVWKLPAQTKGSLANLVAAPDGSYLGFIYPTNTAREKSVGLGIFDLTQQRWLSVPIPLP